MQNRSYPIDVLRGLALVFIVVNHVAGSVLAWGTSRNFGISDASEQFVFLAGLVTALAYTGLAHKRGVSAADHRFRHRAWEIYCAFLVTAALMFMSGGVLLWLGMETPAFHGSEIKAFVAAPGRAMFEVVTLQRQPFFSDILPMYVFFALLTPYWMRLARRSWKTLLVLSLALWMLAPWLAHVLPSVTGPWTFNPFAWQLVFTLGLIVGTHRHLLEMGTQRCRRILTALAVAIVLSGAVFSLFSYHENMRQLFVSSWFDHGVATFSKSNASLVRVANFVAMGWLVYLAAQRGWLDALLRRLTWLATVGRNGLVCFVGGTVISILAETVSHLLAGGTPDAASALLADMLAITSLLALAAVADVWKHRSRKEVHEHLPMPAATWPGGTMTERGFRTVARVPD